ncbi:MAG: DUF2135 domain-containing protein [Pseudomonadota bacterium]
MAAAPTRAQQNATAPDGAPARRELAAPVGGWNKFGQGGAGADALAAYPFSPIQRGAQTGRAMIRGQVAAAGKTRKWHTLVVNGNPTPLYTDADGRFARPYVFGAGSNSVEIRGPDGKPAHRLQFYETDRSRPQPAIRIIGAWDDSQAEVDLHVITPDGQHAFFAHPALDNGGGLDLDTVDGPGPENFVMSAPQRGVYLVWINYWGNFGDSGYHFDQTTRQRPIITSRITLVFNENTPRERREDLVVPLRSIGELTLVKTFVY